MNFLYQSAFLKALGWSLIDSLWQMGCLWLLYTIITFNSKKFRSSQRYSLAVLSMSAGTCWFIVTVALNYYSIIRETEFYSISYLVKDYILNSFYAWNYVTHYIPFVSSLYVVLVSIFTMRLCWQYLRNKNIYRAELMPADPASVRFLQSLAIHIGIRKEINIWLSENIKTPLTIGFVKPIILLPVAAFNGLTTQQAEAILAHELFHIQRKDYLHNLFLSFSEAALFFNPFARILQGIIRRERENSCDDKVLALGYDCYAYTEALYILGRHNTHLNKLALAATGNAKQLLLCRIKRMMNRKQSSPSFVKPLSTFFLCLFLGGMIVRQNNKPVKQVVSLPSKEAKIVFIEPPPIVPVKEEGNIVKRKNVPKQTKKDNTVIIAYNEVPPAPPEPPIPEAEESPDIYLVSDAEDLEFTTIEPVIHLPEIVVTQDKLLPYVPGSAFYYPVQKESTKRIRKIVHL